MGMAYYTYFGVYISVKPTKTIHEDEVYKCSNGHETHYLREDHQYCSRCGEKFELTLVPEEDYEVYPDIEYELPIEEGYFAAINMTHEGEEYQLIPNMNNQEWGEIIDDYRSIKLDLDNIEDVKKLVQKFIDQHVDFLSEFGRRCDKLQVEYGVITYYM